ncbi:pathogenesis-related protein PRB1-3-like [Oryza brachyantha]|uniref:pathogenesis-related protein PRB1-3-like n=1 Tax=Oryza brachyantha TaxID=4533 RepID=UPI001AD98EEE|nr:pathogenesis-related protein PRB1-3-like [Oryza brachyantha]
MSPPVYRCLVAVLSLARLASELSPAAASISVSALPPPPAVPVSTSQQFLQVHNEARAAAGLPPLSWNGTLLLDAMRYAGELRRDCRARPLTAWGTDGIYGRSLYKANGRHTGAEAAAFWAESRRWYDRGADRCTAPPGRCCGVYTQMVWRATTQLGCARRTCRNGVDTVAVCEYYPPGNYVGQRPY